MDVTTPELDATSPQADGITDDHPPLPAPGNAPAATAGLVPRVLTRTQHQELTSALKAAFKNWQLEMISFYVFGQAGYDIFNEKSGEELNAFNLVTQAESQDRVHDLYVTAIGMNPGNPALASWLKGVTSHPDSPYPGLSAFGVENADLFFGRREDIEQLFANVSRHPIVVVTGASGSGKSSVVHAGLVPRWQTTADRLTATFRPGDDPFVELARCLIPHLKPRLSLTRQLAESRKLATMLRKQEIALDDAIGPLTARAESRRMLLIADQFDELFSPALEEAERTAFVEMLFAAFPQPLRDPPPAVLVLAIRADTLGRARTLPAWAGARHGVVQTLEPMDEPQLRLAIERPAEKRNLALDAGLTDLVVKDALGQPGSLAVVQLKMEYLSRLPGGDGQPSSQILPRLDATLIEHADAVVANLDEEDRKLQKLLLHLVTREYGGKLSRRPATRREVGEEVWPLVERLADARLVVTDYDEETGDSTLTLAHDAYARDWPLTQERLQRDAKFFFWLEELREIWHDWFARRDQPDAPNRLLGGADLDIAEGWLDQRGADLSPDQRQFMADSIAKRERERQEKADIEARVRQAEADHQRKWRLGLVGGLVTALLVAAVVGWFAWQADGANTLAREALATAESAKIQAETEARTRASVQLARLSEERIDDELDLALLLAVEAMAEEDTPQARRAVINGLASADRLDTILVEQDASKPITAVAFSPDGELLVAGSSAGVITIWDFENRGRLRELDQGAESGIRSLAFSPRAAESVLAVGTMDGIVALWNLADGQNPAEFDRVLGHGDAVTAVAFAPSGRTLATGSADGTIKLWGIASGETWNLLERADRRQPAGHVNAVTSIAFRSDTTLASGSTADGAITFWNVASGQVDGNGLFNGVTEAVSAIAFAPEGTDELLAAGETGGAQEGEAGGAQGAGRIVLWDPERREPVAGMPGHGAAVSSVVFSPDAKTLASSGWDKAIHLWTVERSVSDQQRKTLKAHDARVTSIAFHPLFVSPPDPDDPTTDSPPAWVVSGDVDGALLVWDAGEPATLDHLAQEVALTKLACERVTRNLTPAELDIYFPQEKEEHRQTCAQYP